MKNNKIMIDEEFLREQYVNNNRTSTDIAKELGLHPSTVQRRIADYGIEKPDTPIRTDYQPTTKETNKLEQIILQSNISPAELQAIIDQIKNPKTDNERVQHYWGEKHVKIGLVSDLHIGSKYVDYSALEDIYKRFKAEGVDAVYIAGDLTEGYERRKGHSYEVDLHGVDEQAKGVVERVPFINKPQYFILGDHDHWHFQNSGTDIGKQIESGRDDMHNLGFFQASIDLFKNTDIMLMHPAKGTAYAISYVPQKIIESLSGGEKPSIMAVGHFHKVEHLFYRNIELFQTGCVQGQTPWMKRMNISAHKAGWLLDIYAKDNGWIDRLKSELFAYY